jgi:hypothetical protein
MDLSFLSPSGEYFTASGLSNAKDSRNAIEWMGIDDFSVFNPYCHHEVSPPQGFGGFLAHPYGDRVLIDYRLDYTKPLPGSGMP